MPDCDFNLGWGQQVPEMTGAGQGHEVSERNRFVGTALAAGKAQAPARGMWGSQKML